MVIQFVSYSEASQKKILKHFKTMYVSKGVGHHSFCWDLDLIIIWLRITDINVEIKYIYKTYIKKLNYHLFPDRYLDFLQFIFNFLPKMVTFKAFGFTIYFSDYESYLDWMTKSLDIHSLDRTGVTKAFLQKEWQFINLSRVIFLRNFDMPSTLNT